MDCPVCKKAVAEGARFCPDCGAALGVGAAGQPAAPAPAAAPHAEAPKGFAALSVPAQLAIGCGIPIAGVLLIVGIGCVVYMMQQRSHAPAARQAVKTLDAAVGGATPTPKGSGAAPAATPSLAGQWEVVYFSGEGKPPPSGLSLREENGELVGELQGRRETKVRLKAVDGEGENGGEAGWKPAVPGKATALPARPPAVPGENGGEAGWKPAVPGGWAGTYADANRPSGTRISADMPGRDRLRITDEDSPVGPEVMLVVDRPGGLDFGPHPRAETKDEATDAVSADPKVADWLKRIDEARASGRKTAAHIDIESDEGEWYIAHVYELVDDGGGQGHTATFGRYYVYKRSGVVQRLDQP